MGIFSQKPRFKVAAPTIRVEKVIIDKPKPRPHPAPPGSKSSLSAGGSGSARASPRPALLQQGGKSGSASPLPLPSSSSADERGRKRKVGVGAGGARRSPAERVEFGPDDSDEEDDDGWKDALSGHKRRRKAAGDDDKMVVDPNRRLRHRRAFVPEGEDEGRVPIIHAADVASLELKCVPALRLSENDVAVTLRYPGLRQRERYALVKGKDKIDAVHDIIEVVKRVAETYIPDEDTRAFFDSTTGFIRQLERASSPNVCDAKAFKSALRGYNDRLLALQTSGSLAKMLDEKHSVSIDLVQLILRQVYDRTVAPRVELLMKYQNGSDNVYGELNAPFSSDILQKRTRMTSNHVFVDLGSGVGNVVLQAALEIGCESWGCEMMENACLLAGAQHKEFSARCRLWGIAPGEVHLEKGDFRTNARIHEALKRADVVLVNNQAFTSQLNDDLVRMFLDLKSGCKIVSLKSFVHDHKSASHNINDVGSTILDVEEFTYPEGYVSWTGAAGTYCVSTRR